MQGQYEDQETGLYYNRYRYFDPNICAYVSQDPLGLLAGSNVYSYPFNTLRYTDPLGLECPQLSGNKKIGKANSKELFLDTASSHDAARKTLINELDTTGAFKNGSNPSLGRLKSSYGYEKQIGRQSLDGKVRWRLDFDEVIGVHYNIEDFSKGKGVNAVKKVIPIDISEQEYKKIIDLWNRWWYENE